MWGKIWPFREPLQFSRTPRGLSPRPVRVSGPSPGNAISQPLQRQRIEMVEAFTKFSATYFEMWKLKERVLGGRSWRRTHSVQWNFKVPERPSLRDLKDHPEWFLGSSVKADGFYSREWPISELEQQMSTVASTAVCSAAERVTPRVPSRHSRVQFTPLRRDEHSWYKTWQSQPMVLNQRIVGGFTFHSKRNERIHNEEDDRYDGEMKFQWLHADARHLGNRPEGTTSRR